jgi:hypothetical protein
MCRHLTPHNIHRLSDCWYGISTIDFRKVSFKITSYCWRIPDLDVSYPDRDMDYPTPTAAGESMWADTTGANV